MKTWQSLLIALLATSLVALSIGSFISRIRNQDAGPLGPPYAGEQVRATTVEAFPWQNLDPHHRAVFDTDGSRLLMVLKEDEQRQSVQLWILGHGIVPISADPIQLRSNAVLSSDGQSIAFIAAPSGRARASLYLWHEGLGLRKLLADAFEADWQLALSGDGRKLVLLPQSQNARCVDCCTLTSCTGALFGAITYPSVFEKNESISQNDPVIAISIDKVDRSTSAENKAETQLLAAAVENNRLRILAADAEGVKNVSIAAPRDVFDVDGDGARDLLLFQHGTTQPVWRVYTSGAMEGAAPNVSREIHGNFASWRLGHSEGLPVAGDYNGDGVLDFATFHPRMAFEWRGHINWHIFISQDERLIETRPRSPVKKTLTLSWGAGSAQAVPADYDGDGATDVAVYYPEAGSWQIMFSKHGFNQAKASAFMSGFGGNYTWGGGVPVVCDYDGDARADLGLYQAPSEARKGTDQARWKVFYLPREDDTKRRSRILEFGLYGDIPVPADYNGDKVCDIAVYRPSSRTWIIRVSKDKSWEIPWGLAQAEPVPADYDADGLADLAFYRAGEGPHWHVLPSSFSREALSLMPGGENVITRYSFGNPKAHPQEVWLRAYYRGKEPH